MRWLRVPASPEEAAAAQSALPAVLSPDEQERGATGLEVFLPGLPDDPLAGLGSPAKRKWGASKKWGGPGGGEGREGEEGDSDDGLPRRAGAQPHSQEARDAKSGKGRRRLFLHPIIRSRERCGTCPVRPRLLLGAVCRPVCPRAPPPPSPAPPRAPVHASRRVLQQQGGPCLPCCGIQRSAPARSRHLSCVCCLSTQRCRPRLAGLPQPALEEGVHDAARRAGGGRRVTFCPGCTLFYASTARTLGQAHASTPAPVNKPPPLTVLQIVPRLDCS